MKLTKREFYLLMYLKESDFRYIARDYRGFLYAYTTKPKKDFLSWYAGETEGIDDVLFSFVTWEDEEPQEIKKILRECEVTE